MSIPFIHQKVKCIAKVRHIFCHESIQVWVISNNYQSNQLNQHIGSCRFVYNCALIQKIKTGEQIRKLITKFDLNKLIPNLKNQNLLL